MTDLELEDFMLQLVFFFFFFQFNFLFFHHLFSLPIFFLFFLTPCWQVQTLKHEPHHSSSLCFFLFLRAMLNPQLLGHTLFWYLESELESVEMADRFRMLKKVLLLSFTEKVRNEFLKQVLFFV